MRSKFKVTCKLAGQSSPAQQHPQTIISNSTSAHPLYYHPGRPYEISLKKPEVCGPNYPDSKLSCQHVFKFKTEICRLLVHMHIPELSIRIYVRSLQTKSRCVNLPVGQTRVHGNTVLILPFHRFIADHMTEANGLSVRVRLTRQT